LFQHPAYDEASPVGDESATVSAGRELHRRRSGARPGPADTPFGRLIGQYRSSFLLLEDEHGLVIVDQHVAHERVLHDQILKRLAAGGAPSQGLLQPVILEVDETRVGALEMVSPLLAGVGIDAEVFGPGAIRVASVPPELEAEEVGEVVEEMLDRATRFDGVPERLVEELREELAASLSCRAAIKINHSLSAEEQRALLADLVETDNPYRCPHGRPIVLRLSQDEMERRLGRR
jgi:DNA mismatch repair protein MutL